MLMGGIVQVPFNGQLNPSPFTFEAWSYPDASLDSDFSLLPGGIHRSSWARGLDPKKTGWGLYLGPSDINNPTPGPLLWQVWMGDGTQFKRVAIAKPEFSPKV